MARLGEMFKRDGVFAEEWRGRPEQDQHAGRHLGQAHPYLTRFGPLGLRVLAALGWLLFFGVGLPWAWEGVSFAAVAVWGWLGRVVVPAVVFGGLAGLWGLILFFVWRWQGWFFRQYGISARGYTWAGVVGLMLGLTLMGVLW